MVPADVYGGTFLAASLPVSERRRHSATTFLIAEVRPDCGEARIPVAGREATPWPRSGMARVAMPVRDMAGRSTTNHKSPVTPSIRLRPSAEIETRRHRLLRA